MAEEYWTVSDEYKLQYLHIPKSGSSSTRWIMETAFNGEGRKFVNIAQAYKRFSFVRDPLKRYISQYHEMFVRSMGNRGVIPSEFQTYWKDLANYTEYQNLFCPSGDNCAFGEAIDDRSAWGVLERFEGFTKMWRPHIIWDVHMVLQTPLLKNKESADVKVDELYGLEDWNASISEIMAQHNIATSRLFKEKRPAREYPSRFNASAISRRTILHICRLLAVDYCCLNYKLPDICGDNDAAGVFCEERGFRIFPKTVAPILGTCISPVTLRHLHCRQENNSRMLGGTTKIGN
jgi:hypothetical protein